MNASTPLDYVESLPTLNWLRTFEAAARHLSFTRAAAELHMTQSAVSQQIKSLENYLGRPLFIREARTLQLTETALNYLPTVQDALTKLTAGTRALIGHDRGRTLTVQSNLAFSVFWLSPRLAELLAVHPWLSLNIIPAIWDGVRSDSPAPVEIRFGRALAGERTERLSEDRCYPVCSPAVAARGADWRTEPLFDCSGMLSNWETWLGEQGERLPREQTVNFATTFAVSHSAVLGGAGLGMAHDTIASHLLAQNQLVRPFSHDSAMIEGYYLVKPAPHDETPASRAFCDWLLERFAREGSDQAEATQTAEK